MVWIDVRRDQAGWLVTGSEQGRADTFKLQAHDSQGRSISHGHQVDLVTLGKNPGQGVLSIWPQPVLKNSSQIWDVDRLDLPDLPCESRHRRKLVREQSVRPLGAVSAQSDRNCFCRHANSAISSRRRYSLQAILHRAVLSREDRCQDVRSTRW